jgi:hypothetical protein
VFLTSLCRFALDLVEVFFQIVHSRLPLLNPAQFRSRLGLQVPPPGSDLSDKPLHPALVATVIAWGSKFSEHPLLIADRKRRGGPSTLSKALIDRARELAENMKVHRKPTPDNVVVALLIEPLQCREHSFIFTIFVADFIFFAQKPRGILMASTLNLDGARWHC